MQVHTVRRNVTQLWQIERDGNPLRRYAHVSPFIGKLAPVDDDALQAIARMTLRRLDLSREGSRLVIGMTESSLLLGWYVAQELTRARHDVDLRFTTRKRRSVTPGRTFSEPHSHGPHHFLSLDDGRTYEQIIIVEDELTTGATLRNLLLTLHDVSRRICVVTLSDMRSSALRRALADEMKAAGVELKVLDLSRNGLGATANTETGEPAPSFNPYGRSETARRRALETLDSVAGRTAGAWYVVGECVDLALCARRPLTYASPAHEAPVTLTPELRQITRSPWTVDGVHVCTRQRFEGDAAAQISPYFLYNWRPPLHPSAVIWAESVTGGIASQLHDWLRRQGVNSHIIEVSAA